jgi:hypothetical protein
MTTTRSNLPKEMTPFGKGVKKAPAKKGKNPFAFAAGGSVAKDAPTHKAAPASNPPSASSALDDGKPSGGGTARGGGAATRGKKFQGTF